MSWLDTYFKNPMSGGLDIIQGKQKDPYAGIEKRVKKMSGMPGVYEGYSQLRDEMAGNLARQGMAGSGVDNAQRGQLMRQESTAVGQQKARDQEMQNQMLMQIKGESVGQQNKQQAGMGQMIGSMLPLLGTAIGGPAGGMVGSMAGSMAGSARQGGQMATPGSFGRYQINPLTGEYEWMGG